MYDDQPYHNGFLDFAYEGALSLEYLETYQNSITWQGNITENNVFVIAALFNPIANIGYAYPPSSKPFEAQYVDAAAAAHPGETGTNTRDANNTHTVFIEEGTATWCKNCPSIAHSLYNLSQTPTYPFYYAAMIEDMNSIAQNRLQNDYNIYGYPTVFYDGGKQVLLGGGNGDEKVESFIKTCAESDVHTLDLNLSVEWQGNGKLKIDYTITNLEEIAPLQYTIKKVFSGIKKITVLVENTGDNDTANVDWQIIITGGLLDRINTSTTGTIRNLPTGHRRIIRSRGQILQPYGIGKINIIIKIGTTVETINGFIIGRLIFVEKINQQQFEVQRIRGGIKKVKAVIKNTGDTDASDVNWEILITGGILNRINSSTTGTIRKIPQDRTRTIRSRGRLLQPRGFGRIDITINVGSSSTTYDGIILGRYIKIFKHKR